MVRHQESETTEFLHGDSAEEFPEPHMEPEELPSDELNETASEDESQFVISEEGLLVEKKEAEEEDENDNDPGEEQNDEEIK